MFRIGDFSRLTRVSIKTLHHYDEIGLFKPQHVDPFTGYRFYSFDQLPRLNRILALKDLGFTLEQVRQVLDGDLSADELRGMLRLRQAQLQQQMDEAREKLAHVEIRLKQIEREGKMSEIEVLLKTVEPITVAGAREVVAAPEQMRERCIALITETCALIESRHLKTDGVSFALYYSSEAEGIDVEMAFAVEPPTGQPVQQGRAAVHTLPAITAAYAVYRGSYDDFGAVGDVHHALTRWIDEHGYRIAGPPREFYLRPPQGPDDRAGVMEIQYPVEKA